MPEPWDYGGCAPVDIVWYHVYDPLHLLGMKTSLATRWADNLFSERAAM
jgi:hypothetical protein